MNNPFDLLSFDPSSVPLKLPTSRPRRPLLELHPDEPDTYILRIDNSTLERLDTCPRSMQYYGISRRQGLSSAALAFGGALHLALEHYYKTGDMESGIQLAESAYAPTVLRPDEWRTPEFLSTTLRLYHRQYGLSDITPLALDGNPLVELPFSYPLGELEPDCKFAYSGRQLAGIDSDSPLYVRKLYILWTGKVDLIYSHVGEPAIMDHKTSSIDAPTFYDQFYLSQPVHGYAWAAQKLIGKPITMFMLNAIIIRKPTKTGTSNLFIRKPYTIHPHNISEFERDVTHKIETFIHNAIEGYFPKSPVWCQSKYGNCQYFSVCTVDQSARDIMLSTDTFEDVTWSPLSDV